MAIINETAARWWWGTPDVIGKTLLQQDGSPSCGSSLIFDGSFSGLRVAGAGVTTALLEAQGVRVFNQGELASARDCLARIETTETTEQ